MGISNNRPTCFPLHRCCLLRDAETKRPRHLSAAPSQWQICTDTELAAQNVFTYYRLRFQIELLLRDAKQYSGLEDCQARNKNKLAFHFNMSLSAVSAAKAAHYLFQPQEDRGAFSLQSIKRFYHNK